MENVKVLSEKEYKIKPFSYLACGDPYYTDEIGKDLTIDVHMPSNTRTREGGFILQQIQFEDEFNGKPLVYETVKVIAYNIQKNSVGKQLVDAHRKFCYSPSNLKKMTGLGCDTAQFDLDVDDRSINVQTGADGFYGTFYHYKDNRAYILELELDPDFITLERIKSDIGYVFDCKELMPEKSDKKKSDIFKE